MINNNETVLAIIFSALIVLNACAPKEPSFGDKLLSRGDEVHKIGEQWSEGESLIKTGNELLLSGRKDVQNGEFLVLDGKSKINKGETMIFKGNQLKKSAEVDYIKRVQHPVLAT